MSKPCDGGGICEDKLGGHRGVVRRVAVYGKAGVDRFWYCETAIEEDRARGFSVEEIPTERVPKASR